MNRFKIYLKLNKKLSFHKVHDQETIIDTKIHLNILKPLFFFKSIVVKQFQKLFYIYLFCTDAAYVSFQEPV